MIIDNTNIVDLVINESDVEFSFDETITTDTMNMFLNKLVEFENANKYSEILQHITLKTKNLPFDVRVCIFKRILNGTDLIDAQSLVNIITLLKSYQKLDDSYFTDTEVYINSLEELLDLKITLKQDFQNFNTQLMIYFLSILKSMSNVAPTFLDNAIDLPVFYHRLFAVLDLTTISSIFQKTPAFNTDKLCTINNAYYYIADMIDKQKISNMLL